jgi:hypothetical protein
MLPGADRLNWILDAVPFACSSGNISFLKWIHRVRDELVSKVFEVVVSLKVFAIEFGKILAA